MSRLRAVLAGVLAAAAAMGLAHLVAALLDPATSPVLVIGSAVIDRTPTPLKDWAIEHFGTNDKTVLLASVVAGTVLLAAISGLLARRRLAFGIAAQLLLVAVAAVVTLQRPTGSWTDLGPALVAAIIGPLSLWWLLRLGGPTTHPVRPPSGYSSGTDTRRSFLLGSGAVAAAAVGTAALGQKLSAATDPSSLALPKARNPLPALPSGLEKSYPQLTPLRTPNGGFYRVDTALAVPSLDRDDWTLTIDGDVDKPYTIGYRDLLEMDLVERDITMTCVSNEVGGGYVGAARWLGVRTRDLLQRAGVKHPELPQAQVFSTATDGFTISTPLGALLDSRDALLAIGMNGAPLPRTHGFPARLVTPGLYGMLGSTKWVTKMRVTTYGDAKAYWTQRGWTTNGPIKPSARIDTPQSLATVKGRTVVGGVAWAQRHGVVKVQLKIDDDDWQDCTLGPDVGVDYWRQWVFVWERPSSGQHTLQARVVYGDDQVQSADRAPVFPSGSSGIQQLVVLGG